MSEGGQSLNIKVELRSAGFTVPWKAAEVSQRDGKWYLNPDTLPPPLDPEDGTWFELYVDGQKVANFIAHAGRLVHPDPREIAVHEQDEEQPNVFSVVAPRGTYENPRWFPCSHQLTYGCPVCDRSR